MFTFEVQRGMFSSIKASETSSSGVTIGWQRVDETRNLDSEEIHVCGGEIEIPLL